MKKVLLAFLIVSAAVAVHADEMPTITVLDFKVNNVSQGDMESIVSFLSASLFATGLYQVIDSSQRDAILKELEFSSSDCTDEACQLEIGKLLSAELIVIGDIGKVGSRYMLTAKTLETETSRTASTATGIYGDLDALLDDMNTFAARLAGIEEAAEEEAAETAEAAEEAPEPVERERQPRQPVSPKRIAAWSFLGAGVVAAGVGGYLFYAATAYRTDVVQPSYEAYKTQTTDYGELTAEQFYDGLWQAYTGNLAEYQSKAIVATVVAAGGVVFLGASVVLFVLPDAQPGVDVSLVMLPQPRGAELGLRIRY